MDNPTPYHDLNRVLEELVRSAQDILRANFVGAYLQGSFAVGDFDLHSDVDWTMVVEEDLSAPQVEALQAMHERVYHLNSRWAQHLEGSYFPKGVIRAGTGRGAKVWYLENGARVLIPSDHCNTLVVRSVVREQGIILAGPDPRSLVDPVPPDDLRREIFATMNDWGQQILDNPQPTNNRFYQAYVVLNYCRMRYDLHRGACGSKLWGAEWAVRTLDPAWAPLIDRSWARRSNAANWIGLPTDPADYQLTLDFLRYILNESRVFMASLPEGAG